MRIFILVLSLTLTDALYAPFLTVSVQYQVDDRFALHSVDARPELGISYKVFRYDFRTFSEPTRIYPNYKIEFGKLSRKQFDHLIQTYSSEGATVPYDATRSYELLDFLPPIIQALQDTAMISEGRFVSQAGGERSLRCNCWGTAYEVNRNGDNFVIFHGNAKAMARILSDDKYSTHIWSERGKDASFLMRTPSLKPRDTILMRADFGLIHAATYIDQGLIFEKLGAADDAPFRLAFIHDKSGKQVESNVGYKDANFEVRRFNQKGKLRLPHPKAAQVIDLEYEPYAEIPLKASEAHPGRKELVPQAFDSLLGFFRNYRPCLSRDLGACADTKRQVCVSAGIK